MRKPTPGTVRSKITAKSINPNELVSFIGKMTELDDDTIASVLNSELLFLKMKGVAR